MVYTAKEVRNMKFDVYYINTQYRDLKDVNFEDLKNFLKQIEYEFGSKWGTFVIHRTICDAMLCHVVNTLYKHDFITCISGELKRNWYTGKLVGQSKLLEYTKTSNYIKRYNDTQMRKLERAKICN